MRLDAPTRPVSLAFEEEDDRPAPAGRAAGAASRAIIRVRIRSGAPTPLDIAVEHEGQATTARIVLLSPRAKEREVPFGYREFAACVAGEIQRHEVNLAFEEAARAAEEMIALWRKA